MGATELQVFVSLVVILGAAFVALICDFLKGNNEQLRESNIELKVRADERDKRDVIIDQVQRRAIELVSAAGRAPVLAEPAATATVAVPAPAPASALTQTQDAALAERRPRARRQRPTAPATGVDAVYDAAARAAWAEEVFLRHFPHPEPKPAAAPAAPAVELVPVSAPAAAVPAPVSLVAAVEPEPVPQLEVAAAPAPVQAGSLSSAAAAVAEPVELVAEAAAQPEPVVELVAAVEPEPVPQLEAAAEPEPAPAGSLAPAAIDPLLVAASLARPAIAALAAQPALFLPGSPLSADTTLPEPVALQPVEQPEVEQELVESLPSNVVRIRVIQETDLVSAAPEIDAVEPLVAEPEPVELPAAAALESTEPEPEPVFAVESAPAEVAAEPEPTELPAVAAAEAVELEPVPVFAAEIAPAEPVLAPEPVIAASVEAPALESLQAGQPDAEASPSRSNLLEMPSLVAARPEPAPLTGDLVVPGGFHESQSLARLLEDERPYQGLAMVVCLVDYVRLMADQGKPAMEEMMASITRLVVSMTREQDFACRIAEDEFVLLFVKETGAAAKRRLQLVSERLWDFQLRSLGAISIIFSWGSAESTDQPLSQVVESARQQMLDSRRNRRTFLTGSRRFTNRAIS